MNCSKCGNEMRKRTVKSKKYTGPKGVPVYEKQSYCPYCEWKGDAGIGATLKQAIKEHNNEQL